MFMFGVISIEIWPTEFPVWGLVLALIIGMPPIFYLTDSADPNSALVYVIPIGMIQAITNQQIGLK